MKEYKILILQTVPDGDRLVNLLKEGWEIENSAAMSSSVVYILSKTTNPKGEFTIG